MPDLITGTVRSYDPGKRYGFVDDVQTGQRVFFHLHDFARPSGNGQSVVLVPKCGPKHVSPQPGDQLVFLLGRNKLGAKARIWAMKVDYDRKVRELRLTSRRSPYAAAR